MDADGRLFIARTEFFPEPSDLTKNNTREYRLEVYDAEGKFLDSRLLDAIPSGMVFNNKGELILVGEFNGVNRVFKFVPR